MPSQPEMSYTEETIARSNNDRTYFERREKLYRALQRHGFASSRDLADELAWGIREVTAKLRSLAKDGMVEYDPPEWFDVWDAGD